MKQQENQQRSEQIFNVGDWVFLRLQPYKQMSMKNTKKDNKLSPNTTVPTRCYKTLVVWTTNWNYLHPHESIQFSMFLV